MGKDYSIIYVANSSWYLFNFRLNLMKRMKSIGWHVIAIAPESDYSRKLEDHGITYEAVSVSRKGVNIFEDILYMAKLYKSYKRISPDLVHHYTIKPIIYGSAAAMFARIPRVVNSVTGLGHVFSNNGIAASILRQCIMLTYRSIFKRQRQRIVFQNSEDMKTFIRSHIVKASSAVLIRGSGVDTSRFSPSDKTDKEHTILYCGRMLWNKGVGELVEAAKLLKQWQVPSAIWMAGALDFGNPEAITQGQLHAWEREGNITWLGHRDDIEKLYAVSHIVVLPTFYKEGLPKSLIEAAASGCPVVATDIPGCREIVRDGENGFLVPPHDVTALAQALRKLLEDPTLRKKMGARGREIVMAEFADEHIIGSTLQLYNSLLEGTA